MARRPLISAPAPHTAGAIGTAAVMRQVLYATLPGLATLVWLFGAGPLLNVLWAALVALAAEALMLRLRGRPLALHLSDGSALVTGVLLGLSLPPGSPWWLILIGSGFAIMVAKQLYGGLGTNPFNPAMVGYVVLLVSFPLAMTRWAEPGQPFSLSHSLSLFLDLPGADGFSGATPLDTFRTWAGNAPLLAEQPILHGHVAGAGWEWVNLAFLAGGLYLLARRVIGWRIPVGVLLGLAAPAVVANLVDPLRFAGPLFHLFSGAAMLGAFFIATDPVSASTTPRGRLIYALLIGVLVWVIRSFGGYPDALAFAVLLLNLAVPFIDYYTRPTAYGHRSKRQ